MDSKLQALGLDDEQIRNIKQLYKDSGYIHLPTGQGRNTVISTTDSPIPELKTQAEWETDAINDGWTRPQ